MKDQKHILIAPLNWGLGHAVRCIPIINAFLHQGAKVTLASDGDALHLLRAEYPELTCVELPAYDINYKTANMFINIGPQIPKILKAIYLERQFLGTIVSEQLSKCKIDAIISDNRYGLYHSKVPSVFITHQLNISIPNRFVQSWITGRNKKYIQKFSACWVPDYKEEPSLGGTLSHGVDWKDVSYLGLLSRMEHRVEEKVYDVIAVLSGPEPQRSIFEEKIIEQAKVLPHRFLIISGKPAEKKQKQLAPNIEWHSYMRTKELNKAILQSTVVIARSGYSSIMDLVKMKCTKVFLVPTPGQTEQEYLATRFYEKKQFYYQVQKDFNMALGLKTLANFSPASQFSINNNDTLVTIIRDFLKRLGENDLVV